MKRIVALAFAGMLAALPAAGFELPGWLGFGGEAATEEPPRPVVTEIVEDRGDDARSVPGLIASKTEVTMAFQALGRMISRHVELGDRVEEGQLLAELATEDLAATTRAASAAVDSAEVQLSTARTTLERTQALAERGVASDAQLEQAQRGMAAAQAAADQARSELVQAQDAEGFAKMTAPFAGVVSAVYEAQGAVVSAGAPILQLSADDAREAVIDLPESALAALPKDAVFTIWQRTDPNRTYTAPLDRIDPLADIATRTRRLHLVLPADAPFRLGTLIRARVGAPDEPALTLPDSALFERDGQPHVWRVSREGDNARVEAVGVTTGPSYRGRVLVSEGLFIGDEVVARGVNSLQPGQPVGRRVEP
ncbi:efflux RND transporter periplasmic adaptor subunit [Paracoccus saliphilus]|uniref:Efflux RND transporter periplasmic adaptor subunit n=1 Tax=Paracoccus saliphilus TaxID=405559 RepID=A0AA46A572_9RHOB|nr:efflux RND transporter periplasmic adaptor subunit [Paracoccus saliphilus]WCR02461.1 efflux RND transporter periplasmic adaptor subunit [Paracoccus saliphilus]SIS75979.1 RND family efflux transporter, MFP subunit [Paracoccus saliphilus]